TAEVGVTHVVGQDQHDVGLLRHRRCDEDDNNCTDEKRTHDASDESDRQKIVQPRMTRINTDTEARSASKGVEVSASMRCPSPRWRDRPAFGGQYFRRRRGTWW